MTGSVMGAAVAFGAPQWGQDDAASLICFAHSQQAINAIV